VDDFSFRRRSRWGTVLVDLERHRLVDILADRSSETFARWLGEHAAGVQIVSRDRSGEYAEAIRKAAPGAIRVADRFHLLKNLGDVVLWVFQRHSESLQSIAAPGPHELTFKGGLPASTCRSRAVAPAPGAPEDPGRYRRQRCLRISR
jgi:hypothetical protein